LDANGDGKISADELAKAADALKTLDRNDDGVLTPEELAPPGPFAGGGRPGAPPGAGNPQNPGAGAFADRLKQADTNGDGKISKEEAPERLKENFDRLDANKDGFIDQTEAARLSGRPQQRPQQGNPQRRRPQQENQDNKSE
jgi:Ca2+-binding EF-hand superfamily protein